MVKLFLGYPVDKLTSEDTERRSLFSQDDLSVHDVRGFLSPLDHGSAQGRKQANLIVVDASGSLFITSVDVSLTPGSDMSTVSSSCRLESSLRSLTGFDAHRFKSLQLGLPVGEDVGHGVGEIICCETTDGRLSLMKQQDQWPGVAAAVFAVSRSQTVALACHSDVWSWQTCYDSYHGEGIALAVQHRQKDSLVHVCILSCSLLWSSHGTKPREVALVRSELSFLTLFARFLSDMRRPWLLRKTSRTSQCLRSSKQAAGRAASC